MPRKYSDFLSANLFYMLSCYALIVVSVFVAFFGNMTMEFTVPFAVQMIVLEVVAIVVPALFFIFFPYWKTFRQNMRVKKINPSVLLIIPISLVGYIFITGVTSVWMGILSSIGLSPEAGAASIPPPETPGLLLLSIVAIAASPALCEEFLFRGLILPAYERRFKRPLTAIVISGLIFGLMHGQVTAAPGHILLGFVLGYVVIATESLWAGIILHIIQNGMAMVILYFQDNILAFAEQFDAAAQTTAGSLEMIVSGLIIAAIAGVVYFVLLLLLAILYKSRNGRSVFAPREEAEPLPAPLAPEPVPMQPMLAPEPGLGMRFLTWLPLLLTAPLVGFQYISSFLMMVPGFTDWLTSFSTGLY